MSQEDSVTIQPHQVNEKDHSVTKKSQNRSKTMAVYLGTLFALKELYPGLTWSDNFTPLFFF